MKPTQTLNDGIATIYTVTNTSSPGEAPSETVTQKAALRFKRRTIGVNRYYTALQANAQIDMLIRCPYTPSVSTQDIVTINGGTAQYSITLVQTIEDNAPPMMDLTLERLVESYDLP